MPDAITPNRVNAHNAFTGPQPKPPVSKVQQKIDSIRRLKEGEQRRIWGSIGKLHPHLNGEVSAPKAEAKAAALEVGAGREDRVACRHAKVQHSRFVAEDSRPSVEGQALGIGLYILG